MFAIFFMNGAQHITHLLNVIRCQIEENEQKESERTTKTKKKKILTTCFSHQRHIATIVN